MHASLNKTRKSIFCRHLRSSAQPLVIFTFSSLFFYLPAMSEIVCSRCGLQPDRTQVGRLSPWEVAKACAFSAVLQRMGSHLDQTPFEILGGRVDTSARSARLLAHLSRSLARPAHSLARSLARLSRLLARSLLASLLARSAPLACPARSFARSLARPLAPSLAR